MPKKKALVTQSNRLVEARYTLTAAEQKLIFTLISKIHPEDDDLKTYEIALEELAELMGITLSNCRLEIAAITKRLIGRVLTLQSEPGHFIQVGWICRAIHRPGFVSISFVPDLKPYLLHLKSEFTICELGIINQFSGKYTIRIYMLLRQYASIGWREFEITELREILGIEKNEYREYKRFSQRVLAQAKKEMDAVDEYGRHKSDLSFEVETMREGRKIARLKFILIKNKKKSAKPAKNNLGKAVENAVQPDAKPAPPNPPEKVPPPKYWKEFREYAVKNNDVCLIQLIDLDEWDIPALRYDYQEWLRKNYSL